MAVLKSLSEIQSADAKETGGKAGALAALAAKGFRVPDALCLTAAEYDTYLASGGLRDRIIFELGRKRFEDMRWEELWDAALRIRNLFLSTPLPADQEAALRAAVEQVAGDRPVVVRSSAPGEDAGDTSFAGLHESFVNVRGSAEIIKHVRLVWASLWSDAALLYRQELGLDVHRSRMAVLVQVLADGDCSGVAFSRNPNRRDEAVIEAVYGLNAGLVDGTVEPDRWHICRESGRMTSHDAPQRSAAMRVAAGGIDRVPLAEALAATSPLDEEAVAAVYALVLRSEAAFGRPQDLEWTRVGGTLTVLQSRPITTLSAADAPGDQRTWYRTLSRSFENLNALRDRIERLVIPGMEQDASALAAVDLSSLTDERLARETARREAVYQRWHEAYWADCIPFAHGIRLFGQYYNDVMQPRNPYDFMDLLGGSDLRSLSRNRALTELADRVRSDPGLKARLRRGEAAELPPPFRAALETFTQEYDVVSATDSGEGRDAFLRFLAELAEGEEAAPVRDRDGVAARVERFLGAVPAEERARAAERLELARASYRWRDDDNLYLDAVEAQWRRAQREVLRRAGRGDAVEETAVNDNAAPGPDAGASAAGAQEAKNGAPGLAARQLVGQPAGPGVATGIAHVVATRGDLLDFKRGEIMVCDAISPAMTFAVPLAGAVVERRGGMLIHGAIIAREYGIPCVTGVPEAAQAIQTGMRLTVDGYLGIVRVNPGSFCVTAGEVETRPLVI